MQWNFYIFYLINFNHFLETNLTQIDLKKKTLKYLAKIYASHKISIQLEWLFCSHGGFHRVLHMNYQLLSHEFTYHVYTNSMMELKLGKKWAIYLLWWLTSFDFPLLPHYTILSFLVFFIKVILCFHSYLFIWTNTL